MFMLLILFIERNQSIVNYYRIIKIGILNYYIRKVDFDGTLITSQIEARVTS